MPPRQSQSHSCPAAAQVASRPVPAPRKHLPRFTRDLLLLVTGDFVDTPLVHFHAHLDGALTQADVMLFVSGEILDGRAE